MNSFVAFRKKRLRKQCVSDKWASYDEGVGSFDGDEVPAQTVPSANRRTQCSAHTLTCPDVIDSYVFLGGSSSMTFTVIILLDGLST